MSLEEKKDWKSPEAQEDVQRTIAAQAKKFQEEEMKLRLDLPESVNSLLRFQQDLREQEAKVKKELSELRASVTPDVIRKNIERELKSQLETITQQQEGSEKEIWKIVNASKPLRERYIEYLHKQSVHEILQGPQQVNFYEKK